MVQNALGDRYEIRIPKDELGHPLRLDFEDEIELAKADADAKKGGEKDAGKTDAPKGDAPKGPSGSGSGGGRDGDPKYGPQ